LLLGTTALSLVTTPLLFRMIPIIMHLGVLMGWFPPDSNQTEHAGTVKGAGLNFFACWMLGL